MFYSQFILAKKGPLGTIWIAAHLERKLRKNQVADTDIGVSVDSILFPDVPIALRLSSHLLLGVVRIYSRKVNYLFDDCSEALLKVKQAFRSTAVDLPPEESKAPYHSITLPETFDLDDFELPDNDIFQGNFVDHHISSREQITLQDNMEGVVYSTSQFGLDERFGDGDTSGLDLDEELLMGKVDGAGYSGVSADPQTSFNSMTHVKLDEHDEGLHANAESQMANVVGDVGLMDYAQAPSTPGLVEEPNLSNVQETSCCDDHIESEENHLTEFAVKDLENASTRLILHQGNEHVVDWSIPNSNSEAAPCNGYHTNDMGNGKGFSPPTEDTCKHVSSEDCAAAYGLPFVDEVGVDHEKPILVDKIIAASGEEELEDDNVKVDGVDVPAVDMSHGDHEFNGTISEGGAEYASGLANATQQVSEGGAEKSNDLLNAGDSERPSSPRDALSTELQVTSGLDKPEISLGQVKVLRPCSADLGKPDPSHTGTGNSMDFEPCDIAVVQLDTSERVDVSRSTVVQGEICNSVGDSEQMLKEKNIVEPASPEDVCAGSVKLDDLGNNMMQGHTAGIECPAPEKMLSVPEGLNDQPRNFLMESTPADMARVDASDAGSRIVSGKKRSYTESTLTEQSLNSVESSRAIHIKKSVEAIPDDDDLLSSILVGRRSSALKVKPTPPPGEITSLKRHRTAPRTSNSKRKVLMDDTMVLHGDTIRQQLLNTEDIRRLRKKAPCTRPEIAMIQRQFLEDQIFRESIFSGVSIYLASLHNQTYDLSGITISKDEVNDSFTILTTEPKSTSKKDETDAIAATENAVDSSGPTAIVVDDRDWASELETVRENGEIRSDQNCELNDVKLGGLCEPTEDLAAASDPSRLQIEPLHDLAGNDSFAEAVNPPFPLEIGPSDRVSSDIGDVPSDAVQPALLDKSEMDAPVQMDPLISCDEKRESECVEVDASVMHRVTGKVNDDNDGTVYVGDFIASDEIGHSARDGFAQEASQGAAAVEIDRETYDQVEYNDHGPSVETEVDMHGSRVDNHGRTYDGISGEEPIISLSDPAENFTSQASFLHEGEDFMLHESNFGNMLDADVSGVNIHYPDDPNYSATANDTEFLNVDDDEVAEVTDDYIPDAEEIRFTENSGWSSRTRAVANYLQTLFVKEAECGRKAIQMDNLLVGKTRKEASRMFFEALVLKTRDYIHVEQQCPFDNIVLKPKAKLVKSDF